MNYRDLFDEMRSTLAPMFTRLDIVEFAGTRKDPEHFTRVEVHVKTARAWSGGDECDGTQAPDYTTMDCVAALAKQWDLFSEVSWHEVEKGWGILCFSLKEPVKVAAR